MKSFNELPEISEVTLGRAPFFKLLPALLDVYRRRYRLVNVVKLTVLAIKRKLYSLYFSIMFVLMQGARVDECAELE